MIKPPSCQYVFKTKHFKLDEQKNLNIKVGERNKFLDDFGVLRHEIQHIKNKTS